MESAEAAPVQEKPTPGTLAAASTSQVAPEDEPIVVPPPVVEQASGEASVGGPPTLEPTVAEPTAEPTVAEPTVAEPRSAEPPNAEPTVAEARALEPPAGEPLADSAPAHIAGASHGEDSALGSEPAGWSAARTEDQLAGAESASGTSPIEETPAGGVAADVVGVSATTGPAESEPPGAVGRPVEGAAAWRRLLRMGHPRATKANVLVGLLAVLLGLAIATQVQLTQERGLNELSQTDLIRVLDDVSSRSSRLDAQIRELEATRDRLKSGAGSSAEALEQAQKRADTLGILAGTVGATGPGVTITLDDPQQALTAPIILDLVQELRDAGAEAIDVGGVRVVASSFVGEVDGDITIGGTRVTRPIRIKSIGDSKTLSSAMTIPGGIVETVRQKGASATVVEQDSVEITSLHEATEPKNATVSE